MEIEEEWVERWRQTYDGGFDRESKGEREDMTVIFLSPGAAVYAVVGMEEDDEARGLDGFPDRIETFVVQAFANTLRTHDQALKTEDTSGVNRRTTETEFVMLGTEGGVRTLICGRDAIWATHSRTLSTETSGTRGRSPRP